MAQTGTLPVEGGALDASGLASIEFFPASTGAVMAAAPQSIRHDAKGFTLTVEATSKTAALKTLDGVLVVKEKLDSGTVTQAFALTAAPGAGGEAGASSSLSLGLALLMALAGGLILHLLPCRFPLLSVEALNVSA